MDFVDQSPEIISSAPLYNGFVVIPSAGPYSHTIILLFLANGRARSPCRNVGGFAGVSLKFRTQRSASATAPTSFFGAMDGGIDMRKTYDRNFCSRRLPPPKVAAVTAPTSVGILTLRSRCYCCVGGSVSGVESICVPPIVSLQTPVAS
jgi:hypothetical protein